MHGKGKSMIIALGLDKKSKSGGDDSFGSEDSGAKSAFDAFASIVGIPDEKREKAMDALKSFISQCSGSSYDDEESDDMDDE